MSMNHQYVPIAKRTRFQWYKYCENQTKVSRQTTHEVIDEYEIKKTAASKTDHENEACPSTSKVRVKKSDSLDDSDSEEKQQDSVLSTEDDEDGSLSSSENKSEYEPLSSSESDDEQLSSSDGESDNSEDSNYLPLNRKKSPLENTKKRTWFESFERNEKKTASKTSTQNVFEGPCRPTKRKCDEARKVDKVFVDESEEETNHYNEAGPSTSKARVKKSYKIDESSSDDFSKEESNREPEESDGVEELDISEFEKAVMETVGYNSENSIKTGADTHLVYSSDDSDSDVKQEEADGSESNMKAKTFQPPEDDEDESSSSSESEDEDEPPVKRKKSPMENTKKKVRSGSADRKEDDPLVRKARMKKMDKKPMDELRDIGVHERKKAINEEKDRYLKADKADAVKNQEPKERVLPESVDRKEHDHSVHEMEKMDRKTMGESSAFDRYTTVDKSSSDEESNEGSPKDDGGSVDAILDSVIGSEGVRGKKSVGSYKFRFDDSADESMSQNNGESEAEGLFEEMHFTLECEEIGSYRPPAVEKDDNISHIDLCGRGEHGEVYLEEQTGLRCCLCGAVVLEAKDVISKLANYTPAMSKRRSQFGEQQCDGHENQYVEDSNWIRLHISSEVKGTAWELIPARVRAHLYPHQQQGFMFLWENLAGTMKLSELQKLGPRGRGGGGGGCIISHAPGTGKSLLTIVFVETFLKLFPRCCPVIVAPASMILTWEAEFKKWQVGFSFINLTSSRHNIDQTRAIKLRSWSNGGSVLGISYSLYTKLAGNSNPKHKILEKTRNILLDMPGLVVLDEGHTPRNKKGKNWNTLLKLKTKNRVILSGTPFQNNFEELFNTLRLVRPETATNIENEKVFADIIQQNMKKSRSRSTDEDIKKLKKIISPFVHVHEGQLLETKLPGLKESVILLEPPPLQKGLIQNLGNMSNFEYEHKVALVSVHPSLILYCSFSEKEEKSVNKQQLEKVRLQPNYGVKTRFVMELVRLGVSLHEKVLIFSQYIQPLELLKDQIAHAFGWAVGREMLLIEGKIQQKQRQTIINDFNDPDSKVKVLLASTKCCSEGIHLVGASRVVLLDIVWNPAVERQAISRAYRLGQKKVVYTYHLMTAGTTEEEKYDRQVEKGRLAELVFSKSGEEPKKKQKVVELNDKILHQMVDHQQLKDMFKKIRYHENVKG